jgi:nucleoporin NUP42
MSGFGNPSALGQNSSPFGAPTANPFAPVAQPNGQLGGQPANPSPFGAPSQAATINPFGGVPQSNPFGSPQPQQPNPSSQAFGAPSAPNPFGHPPQQASSNPFAPTPTNPFITGANPIQQSQPTNAFINGGQQPMQTSTPGYQFSNGQQLGFQNSAQMNTPMNSAQPGAQNYPNGVNGNVQPNNSILNPNFGAATHAPLESYSTKGPDGRLIGFKGKRVEYKDGRAGTLNPDGTWSTIWFPDGPPPRYNADAQMEDSEYDNATAAAYEFVSRKGKFENGVMPLLPPKAEWISWDF